jgi:hypothetical protein
MRSPIRKSLLVAGSFLVAMGQAGVVSAHEQGGSFTTRGVGAVDFYQVICGAGTHHLRFQVKDITANTAKVSILVHKGTSCIPACARNTTDKPDTDAEYSPSVRVVQGTGLYNMFVKHTAAGSDSYDVQYHCEAANNEHTIQALCPSNRNDSYCSDPRSATDAL